MYRNPMPAAMPADAAERLSDKATEALKFDEYDSDLMHDILGNERLAKPVQDLLISLGQIEIANASFGADPKLAFARLIPQLRELRDACIAEMRAL